MNNQSKKTHTSLSIEWRVYERPNLHSSADFKKPTNWQYSRTFHQLWFAEEYIKTKGNKENVYQIERWVKLNPGGVWEKDLKQRKRDDYEMLPYVEKWAWNSKQQWHIFKREEYANVHKEIPENPN